MLKPTPVQIRTLRTLAAGGYLLATPSAVWITDDAGKAIVERLKHVKTWALLVDRGWICKRDTRVESPATFYRITKKGRELLNIYERKGA